MRRLIRPDAMTRLRVRAHAQGVQPKVPDDFRPQSGGNPFGTMEWDVAGNCQRPVLVSVWTRPELYRDKWSVLGPTRGGRLNVDLWTRCRECETCLKARAAHWRYRARSEWKLAPRTWLVTLTFNPEAHLRALSQARRREAKNGTDFEALPEKERFIALERQTGADVTLALKRLRKGDKDHPGVTCRYLLVAEAHKSGLPHYHMLLHEVAGSAPIRHAAIKRCWSSGYLDAKLVTDERAATYATKYLTKSNAARVRASSRYGYQDDPRYAHSREAKGVKPRHYNTGQAIQSDGNCSVIGAETKLEDCPDWNYNWVG